MASVNPGRDRAATLEYCLEMLGQVAELLQQRAGEPDLAQILKALVASQKRPNLEVETRASHNGHAARVAPEVAAFS